MTESNNPTGTDPTMSKEDIAIYNDKGYVSVADQIEKEVERLRKVAKYKTHEDQQSDLPWSVARIDETRMIIKPGKRLDR